jgi:hypothetical protein
MFARVAASESVSERARATLRARLSLLVIVSLIVLMTVLSPDGDARGLAE